MSEKPWQGPPPIASLVAQVAIKGLEGIAISKDMSLEIVKSFADWLRSHDDIDKSEIPRRLLWTLYAEYSEYFGYPLLTEGRFDRALKPAGFQKRRLSSPGRPWVYFLPDAGGGVETRPAVKPHIAASRKRGRR